MSTRHLSDDGRGADAKRLSDLHLLPRRVYRLRILGMGLSAVGLAQVLIEQSAQPMLWLLWALTGIVWPHVAIRLALRSRNPYQAELRNLQVDSALAGLWVPLIHFNLLPSALLITLATVDKINTGVRGLWWRSLPGMALAMLAAALFSGFTFQPESSLAVILAWLPMLIIHTIAVSLVSYRLVRKVQRQNRLLDELTRTDVLTGLEARRYWQTVAEGQLQQFHEQGRECCLLLIDIDNFKAINDDRGHAAGDDVLRAVAQLTRELLQSRDHAGRIGGDEFALALLGGSKRAERLADELQDRVSRLRFSEWPALVVSLSIGIAQARATDIGLREWMESADRQLYRAKREGKSRTAMA